MLVELGVHDLGVIHSLRLTFGPGMTALTGETGAGKTLLVEAIDLLTGGRSDASVVRPGADEAVVEGRFLVDGSERILSRVVPRSGRSRAYVDGRMAPLSALTELAEDLVDLHGQHSHQSLLRAAGQRQALDAFAGVDLAPLRAARQHLADIGAQLSALGGDGRARARELDLLEFQLSEIEGAAISDPDEDSRLEAEEDLLAEASSHREAAEEAAELLSSESGVSDGIGRAQARLSARAPLADHHARLTALSAELSDLVAELRAAADAITEDPERLDQVRARRNLLHDLCRKYGPTLADVVQFGAEARSRRDELASYESRAAGLEGARRKAEAEVARQEAAVAGTRRAAAPGLSEQVAARLAPLAMPAARLEVSVGSEDPGDDVVLLLAANPGGPLQPLAKVASGGELARVMLAVRLVLSAGPPVLVFDEVDAGVGGHAAVAVGRALADVAASGHQVLVVTHLAQVAAFADQQVAVLKSTAGETTRTEAEVLDPDARVVELSRMLAGHPDSTAARDHARELLEAAGHGR